jgi:hypothetical protein
VGGRELWRINIAAAQFTHAYATKPPEGEGHVTRAKKGKNIDEGASICLTYRSTTKVVSKAHAQAIF